jgi:DNA-binding NarL/FixJ family response regulator
MTQPTSSPAPSRSIRVATVEDDARLRQSLEILLASAPSCECVGACGSAEEAIKLIPLWKPDVVLMDIHLPNRSGVECTAALKELMPSLQVIILTAYEDTDNLFKALRAGACGYLLKRAQPAEILSAIQEVQSGGAPMSSEIARKVLGAFHETAPQPATAEQDLSRREREILEQLLRGLSNKEIAAELSISVPTVKIHIRHIYEKLHVRCRVDLFVKFGEANRPAPPLGSPNPGI